MNMGLLEQKISESGLKKEYIADKLGISRFGLLNKIKNPNRWKASEVTIMVNLLSLSQEETKSIFNI